MNKKRLIVIIVIVVAAVLLAILFDTMLANHRPAITSLEAPERVLPSGICHIVCIASDSDGDDLSYNWSASGGNIYGTGASVNWTAPDSEGVYYITVMVTDGRGTEVMKHVAIVVQVNQQPTITSLVADAEWTTPSGSLQVVCNATDVDGDELSYEWTATGGDISGMGAVANWTAPEKVGMYDVTVVVKDGHGNSNTDMLTISVATGQPPIIEDLLVTAEHCYLQTYSWGYKVGKGHMYDIECIVTDTSGEVSYNWSCDGGELSEIAPDGYWSCDGGEISEISEDGSMITWTAPNTACYVTITVIVSDVADNMSSKNINLQVVSCSPCTFGC